MSHQKDPPEKNGPVIDIFKLVRLEGAKPAPLEEENPPQSWGEVWSRFNRYMMRVVAGLPMFFATAVEGTTRLIRGATIPREVEDRVFRAHAEAEMKEERLQLEFSKGQAELDPSGAERELALLLRSFQDRGLRVHGQQRADGLFIIGIVQSKVEAETLRAIEEIPSDILAPEVEDKTRA